jgi:hypothetical protein
VYPNGISGDVPALVDAKLVLLSQAKKKDWFDSMLKL